MIIKIDFETVVIYDGKHQYKITQYDMPDSTEIVISNVDAENRIIDDRSRKTNNVFVYNKKLFDFTNREKIVNRVKTILVFS